MQEAELVAAGAVVVHCRERYLSPAHNVINGSAFYDLGANGIRIGLSAEQSDTEDNVVWDNHVRDSVVAGYGRVYVGSTGIVQGNGHNNEYSHNEIYDGYKGAIHICYCSPSLYGTLPHDNLVAFNLIHDLFRAS